MFGAELRQRATSHPLACFLRSWVRNPIRVGAVAPSSRLLAKRMVSGLESDATVVELGPGTGTFTRAILAAGVSSDRLHLIEQSDRFSVFLQQRFPGTQVVCGDALVMSDLLREQAGSVDLIVSGLPLLLFSDAQKARLLEGAFSLLGPGGRLHQFTYGGRCPVGRSLRSRLGLKATLIGVTPFNIPPAFVYRFERLHG
jgi:phosphatidylethanolamine/phosphatidyl-N-methylethanolamine N-methyltransferase